MAELDMVINFRLYNGLAGDPHLLLTCSFAGKSESCLFNRNLPFYNWRLKRAKIKLLERFI